MADLPRFKNVAVHRLTPDSLIVRWTLAPHSWPMEDIAFVIFRGATPQGPWEEIAKIDDGIHSYLDADVYAPVVHRNYYYVVRFVSKSGNGYVDSSWADCGPDPDHIATELIRKRLVWLMTRGKLVGAVLTRKTWGAPCSVCYNAQRMVATNADCPNCHGVGYTGGYLQPFYTPCSIGYPVREVQSAGPVEFEAATTVAEIGYLPVTNPQDVFVDVRNNVRYTINRVSLRSHQMVPVAQTLTLTRVDEHASLYDIPVPAINPGEYIGSSWDLVYPGSRRWLLKHNFEQGPST
jgi:hypothetical protein